MSLQCESQTALPFSLTHKQTPKDQTLDFHLVHDYLYALRR